MLGPFINRCKYKAKSGLKQVGPGLGLGGPAHEHPRLHFRALKKWKLNRYPQEFYKIFQLKKTNMKNNLPPKEKIEDFPWFLRRVSFPQKEKEGGGIAVVEAISAWKYKWKLRKIWSNFLKKRMKKKNRKRGISSHEPTKNWIRGFGENDNRTEMRF